MKLPLKVQAPAKVNLCLYVGDKRDDGLHEICSVFQSVSLADELLIEAAPGDGDEVICPPIAATNTVTTALANLRAKTGWQDHALRVTVTKRIPVAAGLGGGSADAAAVLRAANVLAEEPLQVAQLRELGSEVGADVPSQIEPGAYLVGGAGEILEPAALPFPGLAMILIESTSGLSTADFYRLHGQIVGKSKHDLAAIARRLRPGLSLEALKEEVNDLQKAVLALRPELQEAFDVLLKSGALAARVTGTGPTVFGLFEDHARAVAALSSLPKNFTAHVVEAVGQDAGKPVPVEERL